MEEKLLTYLSGGEEESNISELLDELNGNEHLREEFVRMQNICALTHLLESSKNEEEGRRSYQRFLQRVKRKKRQAVVLRVARYVAIALILIASQHLIRLIGSDEGTNTLVVPAGQRANLTLQDGTSVWLNARSTITFPARFSVRSRRVTVSGEAYFDVAKNPKRPFIVTVREVETEVLGTRFNVSGYPEAVCVKADLEEGSIRVYRKGSPTCGVTLKPNEQVEVKEGEMIVGEIQNPEHFLWREGIYTFDNELLIEILKKLQFYYDVKIVIKAPEIMNVRYTGKFRQRDGIDEIIRIIQKIQGFNVQKDTEKNTITITK